METAAKLERTGPNTQRQPQRQCPQNPPGAHAHGQRAGHFLHRVHLPAAAGVRFCAPLQVGEGLRRVAVGCSGGVAAGRHGSCNACRSEPLARGVSALPVALPATGPCNSGLAFGQSSSELAANAIWDDTLTSQTRSGKTPPPSSNLNQLICPNRLAAQGARRSGADWRQRPVGQHHRRH